MQLPLQITFHNMETSDALADAIRHRAEGLEKYFSPIISCRVLVEANQRHIQGNTFHVRIDLKVAGQALAVNRSVKDQSNGNAYLAVRDAFDAMRRQVDDFARRQRTKVKSRDLPVYEEPAAVEVV